MTDLIKILFFFAAIFAVPAAWLTHIIVCLTAGKWGFLIAGAIFFPIGIVHGLLIWIGAA